MAGPLRAICSIKGADFGREAFLAGVSVSYATTARLNFFADYDLQAESHKRVNRVTACLQYLW